MSHLKALVIQMPFEVDLHNVIQVAKAEGMKIFKVKTSGCMPGPQMKSVR